MALLRPEEYLYLKREALWEAKENLIGTDIIARDTKVPSGAQEWGRDKYEYPTADSPIMSKEDEYSIVQGKVGRLTGDIFKFGEAFRIPIRDIQSARTFGGTLNADQARMCGRVLAEKINKFLLIGDTESDIDGVYTKGLDNIDTITDTWDSADGDPYLDFNETVGTIEGDMKINSGNPLGLQVNFAVFNPADVKYLRTDDAFGNVYFRKLLDNLSIPRERIYAASDITSGDVLVGCTANRVAEIKESDGVTVSQPIPLANDTIQVNMNYHAGLDIIEEEAFRVMRGIV